MRALLLAAVLGTRLQPLTSYLPKCLVPIHGRPLLDYWLESLLDHGFCFRGLPGGANWQYSSYHWRITPGVVEVGRARLNIEYSKQKPNCLIKAKRGNS